MLYCLDNIIVVDWCVEEHWGTTYCTLTCELCQDNGPKCKLFSFFSGSNISGLFQLSDQPYYRICFMVMRETETVSQHISFFLCLCFWLNTFRVCFCWFTKIVGNDISRPNAGYHHYRLPREKCHTEVREGILFLASVWISFHFKLQLSYSWGAFAKNYDSRIFFRTRKKNTQTMIWKQCSPDVCI